MLTYSALAQYTKRQLMELIEWYGLGKVSKYKKKSYIIDFILEKLHVDESEENEPPMSARVKRIKEQNK